MPATTKYVDVVCHKYYTSNCCIFKLNSNVLFMTAQIFLTTLSFSRFSCQDFWNMYSSKIDDKKKTQIVWSKSIESYMNSTGNIYSSGLNFLSEIQYCLFSFQYWIKLQRQTSGKNVQKFDSIVPLLIFYPIHI